MYQFMFVENKKKIKVPKETGVPEEGEIEDIPASIKSTTPMA